MIKLHSLRIKTVVVDIKAVIDELDRNFTSAKSLILELARLLDETKQCKQSQICTKIKEMLADKIKEGKITKNLFTSLITNNAIFFSH